jgi:hypothetical protein
MLFDCIGQVIPQGPITLLLLAVTLLLFAVASSCAFVATLLLLLLAGTGLKEAHSSRLCGPKPRGLFQITMIF